MKALNALITQQSDARHIYIVFHFQRLTAFSPRLRHAAEDLIASLRPDQTLHAAIVLRDSLITNLLRAFTAFLNRQFAGRFNYRLFRDETAALAWLRMEQAKRGAIIG